MGRFSKLFGRETFRRGFNPKRQPRPLAHCAWVSETLLVQPEGDQLSDAMALFPERGETAARPSLVHVINLYPEQSGDTTQANTIASMQRAAQAYDGALLLINVQAASDPDQTPQGFERAPDLTRSILDVAQVTPPRPLPLLFDILDNGAAQADPGDYIVFTNADICLQPYFYEAVAELISYGFDSLVINRRTVGERFANTPDSALLRSETGKIHPGFDCLIFKKELYDRFIRNDACVGMGGVIMGLLYNMVALSPKMLLLNNVAMTYHFGDDLTWRDDRFRAYMDHNRSQYRQTLRTLLTQAPDPAPLIRFFQTRYNPPEAREVLHAVYPDRSGF